MKKLLLAISAACMIGCASQQLAPRFEQPSTAPIAQAHKAVSKHIESARVTAQQLDRILSENPQAKALVEQLTADLNKALAANAQGEGARVQLETQLKQQTDKANALATNYDKQGVQVEALKVSRHRWVNYFLGAALLNILCLGWIFRKPLLLLVGL